jgi:hypothetical protein
MSVLVGERQHDSVRVGVVRVEVAELDHEADNVNALGVILAPEELGFDERPMARPAVDQVVAGACCEPKHLLAHRLGLWKRRAKDTRGRAIQQIGPIQAIATSGTVLARFEPRSDEGSSVGVSVVAGRTVAHYADHLVRVVHAALVFLAARGSERYLFLPQGRDRSEAEATGSGDGRARTLAA